MKLTILNAVRLYDALSALSHERLPFASARAVVQMRQALAPEKTLMAQEERKLAEQFGGTIDGGTVRFESADASDGFRAAQAELRAQEIDVKLDRIRLPDTVQLTPDEYDALACILEDDV